MLLKNVVKLLRMQLLVKLILNYYLKEWRPLVWILVSVETRISNHELKQAASLIRLGSIKI